ncbi:putative formate dehydrogenase, beta subunit [groundwater metagenome]|uniref:Putative formate dehydrogenase, beta subunit n=1 Tax=groundwater metagenome TaxID=717931 RepID=A0A098E8B0_9ZZZZ
MTKSLLIDLGKCTACRSCIVACKSWNKLEPRIENRNQDEIRKAVEKAKGTDKFSDNEFTYIHEKDIKNFYKRQCMHCDDPQCVKNCPAHAIVKYDNGAVGVDKEKCEGVGLCAQVCPFGVPVMDEYKKPVKCTLCYDRITQNPVLEPACVKTCPSKALKFGDIDEMKQYASKYKYVYGGGVNDSYNSSVIYSSNIPFEEIDFKVAEVHNIANVLDAIKHPVGVLSILGGAALVGLKIYGDRKKKVQEGEK